MRVIAISAKCAKKENEETFADSYLGNGLKDLVKI